RARQLAAGGGQGRCLARSRRRRTLYGVAGAAIRPRVWTYHVAAVARPDEPVFISTARTIAIRNSAGTAPTTCPPSTGTSTPGQAMMAPCTTLDQTVNQMRLLCAYGSRDAMRRNTPSVA